MKQLLIFENDVAQSAAAVESVDYLGLRMMARSMQARICLGWFCTAVAQQPSACRDAPEFGLPATWRTTTPVRGCGCRHLSFCVRRERKKRERIKGWELYITCPIMLQFNWIVRSKLIDHFTVCFENYTVVALMSEREADN